VGAVRWAEVVRRQASNGLYLKPPGDGIPAAPRPVHLAFVCVVNKSFFEISNRCRLKWHNCCQLGCSAARQLCYVEHHWVAATYAEYFYARRTHKRARPRYPAIGIGAGSLCASCLSHFN